MTDTPEFRRDCLAGRQQIGTFAAIPHPVAVEVLAAAGPDFLSIDTEHAQIGRDTLENLIRAADAHAVPALVRVPGHGQEAMAAALDSGARGVLVPRVSTPEQAAAAVRFCRFPPHGERGVGPGRAAGYGYRILDHLARANAETVVAVQVETAAGLANAAEIAAVDGVDVVFVGPGDLSVSIGAIGPEHSPRLAQAIETVIAASLAAGKTAGLFCGRPADVAGWRAKGASFFILASDTMFLGDAAASQFAAARAGGAAT